MRIKLKIRGKILLLVLTTSVILYTFSMAYILFQSRKVMYEDTIENARLAAENSALKVEMFLETNITISRTLAQGLSIFHTIDSTIWQPLFLSLYRPIIERTPHITTIWDSWELNSYVPQYTNPYGRYCITLYRNKNFIEELVERRSMEGDPPLYASIKKSNAEQLLEPYYDEVIETEQRNLTTSMITPVQHDGKYVGLVGIDVTLQNLQKQVESVSQSNGSYARLISSEGVIAAHHDTTLIFKNIADIYPEEVKEHNLLETIKAGKTKQYTHFNKEGANLLTILVPVKAGNAQTKWTLAYTIPMKIITSKIDKSIIVSTIVGLIGLVIMVGIVVFLANNITRPISLVTNTLTRISQGELSHTMKLDIKTGDEIEDMSNALNQSIQGLTDKTVFADNIGKGNYSTTLQLLSNNDELGRSLVEMQNNLINVRREEIKRIKEDKRRHWINEGMARFAQILQKENKNQATLMSTLIKNFVLYLEANQGAIYLLTENNGEKYLELSRAYAWGRKRTHDKKIYPGEGQVGACFHEAKTIHLKKVPQDYIKIGSGLGDANPTSVIIVPMIHEATTLGVLELASFGTFEEYHIEFLEKICQNVAATVSSVRINERTQQLLEKSQEQTEHMLSQEEEMRQNIEELMATQEDMERKELQMKTLVEAISGVVMLIEYDINGTIQYANSQTVTQTGYSEDELVGKHHSILFDNTSTVEKESYISFWNLMRTGKPFSNTFKRKTKDNTTIMVKGYSYPVIDDQGNLRKIIEVGVKLDDTV